MTSYNDYPLTRAGAFCPICLGDKAPGLLVCWPCYREHDMRFGDTPNVTALMDAFERVLESRADPKEVRS